MMEDHTFLSEGSNMLWDGFEWIPIEGVRYHHIKLRTILLSLPRTARWNGCAGYPWTVAHHTVFAYLLADNDGAPRDLKREILLHDAAEAYVGDMCRGMKNAVPGFRAIEQAFHGAIAERFEVPATMSEECRRYDNEALAYECFFGVMPEGFPPMASLEKPKEKVIDPVRFFMLHPDGGAQALAIAFRNEGIV